MRILLIVFILLSTGISMAQSLGKNDTIKLLALGDSYTIGESVTEPERWPSQLLKNLRDSGYKTAEPTIIATTGWRTDDLKQAIKAVNPAKDYDLVSLLIGVNNQYQRKTAKSYASEFEELLQMAITFAGNNKSKVFVVSIPDYGFTPFGKSKQESISKELDEFNEVNRRITEKYEVRYFYITDLSRKGLDDPALVASDGLHPSGKMYGLWAERIAEGLLK